MNFWITTDTHIGHENIKKLTNRPENCDELIIKGLRVLAHDDILIHLGDVAFHDAGERKYLGNIPCKKWLVLGNHDKSISFHLGLGWDWVGESMELRRFGELIKFSHKPTPIGEETIQFHGHFHNNPMQYWEGELKDILTSKHQLLIIENMGYKPATLKSLVRAVQRARPGTYS